MKLSKSITLEEDLWAKIEKDRGDVSRSKFISNILLDYYKLMKGKKSK